MPFTSAWSGSYHSILPLLLHAFYKEPQGVGLGLLTQSHRSRLSMALFRVRILVGAWIARLPSAAPRSIGSWLRLYDQSHHLAANGTHPKAFGTSATAIAVPVRR